MQNRQELFDQIQRLIHSIEMDVESWQRETEGEFSREYIHARQAQLEKIRRLKEWLIRNGE